MTMLRHADLPTEDLADAPVRFMLEERDGELAGIIGLQVFNDAGLLRSLAVRPASQGQGVGAALVAALETDARSQGITLLVLLTQTAEPFFARQGYSPIRRDATPLAMQQSAEFLSLCPASAICMAKLL